MDTEPIKHEDPELEEGEVNFLACVPICVCSVEKDVDQLMQLSEKKVQRKC